MEDSSRLDGGAGFFQGTFFSEASLLQLLGMYCMWPLYSSRCHIFNLISTIAWCYLITLDVVEFVSVRCMNNPCSEMMD